MKNKEKFKNEIVDIICNGDIIAVDKKTRTPVSCSSIECDKCLFRGESGCSDVLNVWSNQEYKESIVISNNDILFLNFIKNEFEYITRDKTGCLYAYDSKPKKYVDDGVWVVGTIAALFKYNIDFPMVKWSDEQPWKISDLKKLKVVENY